MIFNGLLIQQKLFTREKSSKCYACSFIRANILNLVNLKGSWISKSARIIKNMINILITNFNFGLNCTALSDSVQFSIFFPDLVLKTLQKFINSM